MNYMYQSFLLGNVSPSFMYIILICCCVMDSLAVIIELLRIAYVYQCMYMYMYTHALLCIYNYLSVID